MCSSDLSGMALFAIQLVRMVLSTVDGLPTPIYIGLELIMPMHKMLNVVIRSVHFYFFCFTDNIYLEGHRTNNNFCAFN